MKVCPECGKVIGFNSYFGAYICDDCGWEDDTYNQKRIQYYAQRTYKVSVSFHLKNKKALERVNSNKINH